MGATSPSAMAEGTGTGSAGTKYRYTSAVLLVLFAIARLLVSGMFLNGAIRRLSGGEAD